MTKRNIGTGVIILLSIGALIWALRNKKEQEEAAAEGLYAEELLPEEAEQVTKPTEWHWEMTPSGLRKVRGAAPVETFDQSNKRATNLRLPPTTPGVLRIDGTPATQWYDPRELDPATRTHSCDWFKRHGFTEMLEDMNTKVIDLVWAAKTQTGASKQNTKSKIYTVRIKETTLELGEADEKYKAKGRSPTGAAATAYKKNKEEYAAHLTDRKKLVDSGVRPPTSKQDRQKYARDPEGYKADPSNKI